MAICGREKLFKVWNRRHFGGYFLTRATKIVADVLYVITEFKLITEACRVTCAVQQSAGKGIDFCWTEVALLMPQICNATLPIKHSRCFKCSVGFFSTTDKRKKCILVFGIQLYDDRQFYTVHIAIHWRVYSVTSKSALIYNLMNNLFITSPKLTIMLPQPFLEVPNSWWSQTLNKQTSQNLSALIFCVSLTGWLRFLKIRLRLRKIWRLGQNRPSSMAISVDLYTNHRPGIYT